MASLPVTYSGTRNDSAKKWVNNYDASLTRQHQVDAMQRHPEVKQWAAVVLDTGAINTSKALAEHEFVSVSLNVDNTSSNTGHVIQVQCNAEQAEQQRKAIEEHPVLRNHCTVIEGVMVQQLFLNGPKQLLSDGNNRQTISYNLDFFGTEESQWAPALHFLLHREELLPSAQLHQSALICSTFLLAGGFADVHRQRHEEQRRATTSAIPLPMSSSSASSSSSSLAPPQTLDRLQERLVALHTSANCVMVPLPMHYLWSGREIQQAKDAGVRLHATKDRTLLMMTYRSGVSTMAVVLHLSRKTKDGIAPSLVPQPRCPALLPSRRPAGNTFTQRQFPNDGDASLPRLLTEEEANTEEQIEEGWTAESSPQGLQALPTSALEAAIQQSREDFPDMIGVLSDPNQCQISHIECDFLPKTSKRSETERLRTIGLMAMIDAGSRFISGDDVRGSSAIKQLRVMDTVYYENGRHRPVAELTVDDILAVEACAINFEAKRPPQIDSVHNYLRRRPNDPDCPAYKQFNMVLQCPRTGKSPSGVSYAGLQTLNATMDFRLNLIAPELRHLIPMMKLWHNGRSPLRGDLPDETVPSGFRLMTTSASPEAWAKYFLPNDKWVGEQCAKRGLDPTDREIVAVLEEEKLHIAKYGRRPGVDTALLPPDERMSVWAQSDLINMWPRLKHVVPPQLFFGFSNGYDPFDILRFQGTTMMWIFSQMVQRLDHDKSKQTKAASQRRRRHSSSSVASGRSNGPPVFTHPIVITRIGALAGISSVDATRQIALACADECDNVFSSSGSGDATGSEEQKGGAAEASVKTKEVEAGDDEEDRRPHIEAANTIIRSVPTIGFSGTRAPCRGWCNPAGNKRSPNLCKCCGLVLRSGCYTLAQAVQDGICLGVAFCSFNHEYTATLQKAIARGGQAACFDALPDAFIVQIMQHVCKVRNDEIYALLGYPVPQGAVQIMFRVPYNVKATKMARFVNEHNGPGDLFQGEKALALLSDGKGNNDQKHKKSQIDGTTIIFVNRSTRAYDYPTVRVSCDLLMKSDGSSDRDRFQFVMRGTSICNIGQVTGRWLPEWEVNKAHFVKFINSMETRVFMLSIQGDSREAEKLLAELGGGRVMMAGGVGAADATQRLRFTVDGTVVNQNEMTLDKATEALWWEAERQQAQKAVASSAASAVSAASVYRATAAPMVAVAVPSASQPTSASLASASSLSAPLSNSVMATRSGRRLLDESTGAAKAVVDIVGSTEGSCFKQLLAETPEVKQMATGRVVIVLDDDAMDVDAAEEETKEDQAEEEEEEDGKAQEEDEAKPNPKAKPKAKQEMAESSSEESEEEEEEEKSDVAGDESGSEDDDEEFKEGEEELSLHEQLQKQKKRKRPAVSPASRSTGSTESSRFKAATNKLLLAAKAQKKTVQKKAKTTVAEAVEEEETDEDAPTVAAVATSSSSSSAATVLPSPRAHPTRSTTAVTVVVPLVAPVMIPLPPVAPVLTAIERALKTVLTADPLVKCKTCKLICYPQLKRITSQVSAAFLRTVPTFRTAEHSKSLFTQHDSGAYQFKRPGQCDTCFEKEALQPADAIHRPLLRMHDQVTVLKASNDRTAPSADVATATIGAVCPRTSAIFSEQEERYVQLKSIQQELVDYENAWATQHVLINRVSKERVRTRWTVPVLAHLWCAQGLRALPASPGSAALTVHGLSKLLKEPASTVVQQLSLSPLNQLVKVQPQPEQSEVSAIGTDLVTLHNDALTAAEVAADTYGLVQLLDLNQGNVYEEYQHLTEEHVDLVRRKVFALIAAAAADEKIVLSAAPSEVDVATFGTRWQFGTPAPSWYIWQSYSHFNAQGSFVPTWAFRPNCLKFLMRHVTPSVPKDATQALMRPKDVEEVDTRRHLRLLVRDAPQPFPVVDFPLPPHNPTNPEKAAYRAKVAKALGVQRVQVAYNDIRARDLESGRMLEMKKNLDTDAVLAAVKGRLVYMRCDTNNANALRAAVGTSETSSSSRRKVEAIYYRFDGSYFVLPVPVSAAAAVPSS